MKQFVILMAVLATLCALPTYAEQTEYKYDTGEAEEWIYATTSYGIAAEFHQPGIEEHPPYIVGVRFYMRATREEGARFKWYIYNAPASGGPPGELMASGSALAQYGIRWVHIAVPDNGVRTSRTFYVAFEFYESTTEPQLGNDIHGTQQNNWKYYWLYAKNGSWQQHEPAFVNYMIRAYGDNTGVDTTSLGRVKAVYR